MIRNRIKELRTVKASDLLMNPHNWRIHSATQSDALRGVLGEIGYADALIAYQTPDGLMLIDGHLRAETTPDMEVPVLVTDLTEQEANKLLMTLDPLAAMAGADVEMFNTLREMTNVDNDALQDMLQQLQDDISVGTLDQARESLKQAPKRRDRTLPIDMIISSVHGPYCCIAVTAGLKYGMMSGRKGSPCHSMFKGRHDVIFLDNEFHNYNHQKHLDMVKEIRPKYATARDVMTKEQCAQAGIEYLELPEILDMAEELNEYAENVLIIPKYECLDKIPDKYMIGYSIPTSYGGTPLPIDAFEGRKIHLLGGSWKQQRNAFEILGNDIVSADNNQIFLISKFGSYVNADGTDGVIDHMFSPVSNVAVIAFTISCGSIAAGVKEILGQDVAQIQQEEPDDIIRS
mgnify:CR=1 FL=1|tara:strand:- start:6893 stop:8101 length:1209 start_codon:yes stop_codon:yes gene_type:complete